MQRVFLMPYSPEKSGAKPYLAEKRLPGWPVVFMAIALKLFSAGALCAQQRDPAVEIYGLTGAYYFGNRSHDLKGGEWKPQAGGSVLFPVGSRWAVLTDVVASRLEVNEGPHGPPPHEGYAY